MSFFKKPLVAIILCILIVFTSTVVSINVKLNNKCEDVINGFYNGMESNGFLVTPIYYKLNDLCDISGEIVLIAENYGIDTRELSSCLNTLKNELSYHNNDIDGIYDSYEAFYSSLFAVLIKLGETELSQRHFEFMSSAMEQINICKDTIDKSPYNESVKQFYKRFDRFPVNFFADIFDIDFPEYFA